jgi:nickel-dependent lactate racemase
MATIELKYGRASISFDYEESLFEVLDTESSLRPLSDSEIGRALDSPIDSPPLEEIISAGRRVLLVVPDATRQTGAGQIVNLVVRRLIANGSAPGDINIIFATGIHRPVTEEEKKAILTTFIAQRINTINHNAKDSVKNFRMGETSTEIPVELNWLLSEFDHVVLIGGVTFHYFAGFTGGRKLICPGLASAKTIEETHKLAFDCHIHDRRKGVGTGMLDSNPVHEAFVEAAALASPSFGINTIVNDAGEIVEMFCGNWKTSHKQACESYLASHNVTIREKRDLVIASCGGYPFDINMIQAHKALEAASHACKDGGTIMLVAECGDGLGRKDFLEWFTATDSNELAKRLCENYHVNGQTAWSLLKKAEKFDIGILTALAGDTVNKMRLHELKLTDGKLAVMDGANTGYIIPSGAKLQIN